MCCIRSWKEANWLVTFEIARNKRQWALWRRRNKVVFVILQYFIGWIELSQNNRILGGLRVSFFVRKEALWVTVLETVEYWISKEVIGSGFSFEDYKPKGRQ